MRFSFPSFRSPFPARFQPGAFGYRVKRGLLPTCFQFRFQKAAFISRFQGIAGKWETRADNQCQKVYAAEARR
jgi:hypothetical protein